MFFAISCSMVYDTHLELVAVHLHVTLHQATYYIKALQQRASVSLTLAFMLFFSYIFTPTYVTNSTKHCQHVLNRQLPLTVLKIMRKRDIYKNYVNH